MYSKEICAKIIYDFKQKFERRNWNLSGIDWWPIIRIQVCYQISLLPIRTQTVQPKADVWWKLNPKKQSIKFHITRIKEIFLAKFKQRKKGNTVAVFYSSSHKTTASITDLSLKINPYTDFFCEQFDALGIKYEQFDYDNPQTVYDLQSQYTIDYKIEVFKAKLKQETWFVNQLQDIASFFEVSNIPIYNIDYNILLVLLDHQLTYYKWDMIFRSGQFSKVLLYVYYNHNCMAITRAAHNYKLNVVEYQHSVMSHRHFAYAPWTIREGAVSFFPDQYWVWNKSSTEILLKNFPFVKKENIIEGGNLYVSKAIEIHKSESKSTTNRILISLQGMWMPDFLVNAIINSERFLWHIRIHPRYPDDKLKLEELYSQYPTKIEIKEANEKSLPYLFSKIDFHVTSYSGTALEAQGFGVRNIIYGEEGKLVYNYEIENGDFIYANSKEELLKALLENQIGENLQPINNDIRLTIKNHFKFDNQ